MKNKAFVSLDDVPYDYGQDKGQDTFTNLVGLKARRVFLELGRVWILFGSRINSKPQTREMLEYRAESPASSTRFGANII
jgi:hypothetical protein